MEGQMFGTVKRGVTKIFVSIFASLGLLTAYIVAYATIYQLIAGEYPPKDFVPGALSSSLLIIYPAMFCIWTGAKVNFKSKLKAWAIAAVVALVLCNVTEFLAAYFVVSLLHIGLWALLVIGMFKNVIIPILSITIVHRILSKAKVGSTPPAGNGSKASIVQRFIKVKDLILSNRKKEPNEIAQTREAISRFLEKNASFSRSVLEPTAVSLLTNDENIICAVEAIRDRGVRPETIALIQIIGSISIHLPTGNYHIYRGVLNMVGQDMLDVWKISITEMKHAGLYSHHKTVEEIEWMNEQIKHAG
jgi:hypothetical protein